MRIIGKKIIVKVKVKNSGNQQLCKAIDQLVADLEQFNPIEVPLRDLRPDADCVHNDGFYFFNIQVHSTLILIEMNEEGEATIVWAGTHQEYETTFKNNKVTIEKWLRKKGYID